MVIWVCWDATDLKEDGNQAFKFQSSEEKPEAAWKYGKELVSVLLDKKTTDSFLHTAIENGGIRMFKTPSARFVFKEGMQVGIMACSCVGIAANSMESSLRTGAYHAEKGDAFITVGKISHVGVDHIEYIVNTVPGFSGGPVFILNPGEDDHMKLIAIHAGYSEDLGVNFGFLVARKVAEFNKTADDGEDITESSTLQSTDSLEGFEDEAA